MDEPVVEVSLAAVVASGDRLAALRRLRNRYAVQLDGCDSARDVATLGARLAEVMAEIADLAPPAEEKGNPLDELKARRASRPAGPPVRRRSGS